MFSYLFLSMQSSKTIDKFWKYKSNNTRKIYSFSIFLCFVFGLYLLYYFTSVDFYGKSIFNYRYTSFGKYFFYIGFLLFIGISLLWIPTIDYPIINKFVLFFVFFGSLIISASLINYYINNYSNYFDTMAIIASIYLTFHTFVLDFLFY